MTIRLRALERDDLPRLRDWRNDPEIFSRVREYRPLNLENQDVWFNSLRDDRRTIMFGVDLPDVDGEPDLIGVCGLTSIDWVGRKAEVSIYVGSPEHRKKGHGLEILNSLSTYAFGECNLNRLWAEIYGNNLASIKLFEKAGFEGEGVLFQHAYKNGQYRDSFIFGLLRSKWEKSAAPSA